MTHMIHQIVAQVPAPATFEARNTHTSEILMNHASMVITSINNQINQHTAIMAFETRYYINAEVYSKSFSDELKKIVEGYYNFHKYDTSWEGTDYNIIIVGWSSKQLSRESNLSSLIKPKDVCDDSPTYT